MKLELRVDGGDHQIGSAISGEVIAEVDRQVYGTLELGFELITTASTGRPRSLALFGLTREIREGLWEPGAPVTDPFEIPTPEAPASYAGEEVQLAWHLYAKLNVPETEDAATVSQPVELRVQGGDRLVLDRTGVCEPRAVSRRSAGALVLSLVALFAGLGMGVGGFATGGEGLAIAGILLTGFAAVSTWWYVRDFRAKGVVGNVQVDVADEGREITAWTLPGAPVKRAVFSIAVVERSEVGHSESKTVKKAIAWTGTAELESTEDGVWRGGIELPGADQVPPRMIGGSRTILWIGEIVLLDAEGDELWRDSVPIRARLKRG